jgi:hypothetical protein
MAGLLREAVVVGIFLFSLPGNFRAKPFAA